MYWVKKLNVKISKELFLLGFSLVFLTAIAFAQAAAEQVPAESELASVEEVSEADSEPESNEVLSDGLDPYSSGLIQSITFKKDMQIRDALRFLAIKYQKNIVPSAAVDGTLAFTSLYDVTFDEAMEAILGGSFEYAQKGNMIEVFAKGDKNRMTYEVFRLDYISAAEAKKLISPVLSSLGTVGVTSPAETGVPTGESISSASGGGDTMSLKDTLVVFDFAENIKQAKKVIAAVDIRPKQVLIEATLLNAKLTEYTQLGIDWQTLKGTAISAVTNISVNSDTFANFTGTGQVDKTGGIKVGIAIGDVASFIKAVEDITDVTIMANPKILAVNKQLGQVYIGTKLGYREGDIATIDGGTQEGSVKFLDTGTKLSFRPYIGNDDYIRMDIHSKDSSGSVSGLGIPQETSAELATNIMVKDGETIVIGGLFRDKVTTSKTQIPLLGDLPFIGGAFRGTSDTVEPQEVIVLLTPHVIEESAELEGSERAEDVSMKRFGVKQSMQWAGRIRLIEDRYAKAAQHYLDGETRKALDNLNYVLETYPTYLPAIRLKERILKETDPEAAARNERKVVRQVEQPYSHKWYRR